MHNHSYLVWNTEELANNVQVIEWILETRNTPKTHKAETQLNV